MIYLLCGFTGSGKTTYARDLESRRVVRLSIDELVFENHGRHGVDYPEDRYPEFEREAVAALDDRVVELVRRGTSVVLDYGLWSREDRDRYKQLAEDLGGRGAAAPGVYGVPDCWPHVQTIYERAGFIHDGHTEILLLVAVSELPHPGPTPVPGVSVQRELGINGTRFSAVLGAETIGFIEVETDFTNGGSLSRFAGWGDVGNLCVIEAYRRRGIGKCLVGHEADWLRLGRVERLLAYVWPEHGDELAFHLNVGFGELTRTKRGWVRHV